MTILSQILVVTSFFLVMGGLVWLVRRDIQTKRRRRAALEALAAAKGWRLETGRDGRRKLVTLSDPADGWALFLAGGYRHGKGNSRGRTPGYTEMRLPARLWPRGTAIFAPPGPLNSFQAIAGGSGLAGLLNNSLAGAMLRDVVPPDAAEDVAGLVRFEAPAGIDLIILATEDPRGLDLTAIRDAVQGWRAQGQNGAGQPTVTLLPDAVVYRLPEILREAEDVESFAAQGADLARRLGG